MDKKKKLYKQKGGGKAGNSSGYIPDQSVVCRGVKNNAVSAWRTDQTCGTEHGVYTTVNRFKIALDFPGTPLNYFRKTFKPVLNLSASG